MEDYELQYKEELSTYQEKFEQQEEEANREKDYFFSLVQYEEEFVKDPEKDIFKNYEKRAKDETQDREREMLKILYSVLPPKPITQEDGTVLYKMVSSKKAMRADVILLQQTLDEQLQLRQAREQGICPIREQLYAQNFDELLRQITVELPERGLLLLRVKDEARLTMEAYQTLYNTGLAFGTRKLLQAENAIAKHKKSVAELKAKSRELSKQVEFLKNEELLRQKRHNEIKQQENKKRSQQKDFLRHQKTALENFLILTQNNN